MSAEEPWSWRPVEPQRHHTKGMLRKDSLLPMGRMGGNLEVHTCHVGRSEDNLGEAVLFYHTGPSDADHGV